MANSLKNYQTMFYADYLIEINLNGNVFYFQYPHYVIYIYVHLKVNYDVFQSQYLIYGCLLSVLIALFCV